MGLPDTGNPVEDAKTLGRGLMRGNADELKLGYDWRNALLVVIDHYSLEGDDRRVVAAHLIGYALGLTAERATDSVAAYAEGVEAGERNREGSYPSKVTG